MHRLSPATWRLLFELVLLVSLLGAFGLGFSAGINYVYSGEECVKWEKPR